MDGYYCLSCGSDKKLKLWNYETGLLLKTYGGHADEVTDAAGSCDSSFIVSSSLDKSIIYWDVSTGVPVRRLRGHAGGVKCVCFNEDSSIAISGGRDNAVACWDIRTRSLEPIQKMRDAKDCITSVLTNERYIITSSLDGCVRHYDIRAGELICDEIRLPITYLALSKDDQCVLAACRDGVARLLDCESNGILSEYKGHQVEDYHVECGLLENDTIVVSGSCNGDVFLWDLIKSETMRRIEISKLKVVIKLFFSIINLFCQIKGVVWYILWIHIPNWRAFYLLGGPIYISILCKRILSLWNKTKIT